MMKHERVMLTPNWFRQETPTSYKLAMLGKKKLIFHLFQTAGPCSLNTFMKQWCNSRPGLQSSDADEGWGPTGSTHLFPRQDMPGQLDLGKVALADGLQQPVVADMWVICWCGNRVPAAWHAWAASCFGIWVWLSACGTETKRERKRDCHEDWVRTIVTL